MGNTINSDWADVAERLPDWNPKGKKNVALGMPSLQKEQLWWKL